jgi:hypothetical protein
VKRLFIILIKIIGVKKFPSHIKALQDIKNKTFYADIYWKIGEISPFMATTNIDYSNLTNYLSIKKLYNHEFMVKVHKETSDE